MLFMSLEVVIFLQSTRKLQLGKEIGFQDVSEDDVELSESPSLSLTAEEPADLERQIYRKAQGDEDVKDSVN
jgi:hypothetical protein